MAYYVVKLGVLYYDAKAHRWQPHRGNAGTWSRAVAKDVRGQPLPRSPFAPDVEPRVVKVRTREDLRRERQALLVRVLELENALTEAADCLEIDEQLLEGQDENEAEDARERIAEWRALVEAKLIRAPIAKRTKPVCRTCGDTRRMLTAKGSKEPYRGVACTDCPKPCKRCRGSGNGANESRYCATTPCSCACHRVPK